MSWGASAFFIWATVFLATSKSYVHVIPAHLQDNIVPMLFPISCCRSSWIALKWNTCLFVLVNVMWEWYVKHFRIDISLLTTVCVRNGHNSIVSTMECVDTFSFAVVWLIFWSYFLKTRSLMERWASSTCFKTRISQSCYLIPSDELESGPSSAQRESTLHELLPNIISAISPLSWTSEHGNCGIRN